MISVIISSITAPLFRIFAAATCSHDFFGIPPWYKYLADAGKLGADCQIKTLSIPGDLTLIALGFLDILLRVAGLVAVGFVVWGGIQYVTSQGEPGKTKQAQGTIINALIGLVVTLIAVAGVSFVGNALGK